MPSCARRGTPWSVELNYKPVLKAVKCSAWMCAREDPLEGYLQEDSAKGLSDTDHEQMPVQWPLLAHFRMCIPDVCSKRRGSGFFYGCINTVGVKHPRGVSLPAIPFLGTHTHWPDFVSFCWSFLHRRHFCFHVCFLKWRPYLVYLCSNFPSVSQGICSIFVKFSLYKES